MKHLTCDKRSTFGGKIANSLGDVLRPAWPAHWSLADGPLTTLIRHAVAEKLSVPRIMPGAIALTVIPSGPKS